MKDFIFKNAETSTIMDDSNMSKHANLASKFFHARTQTHIWHLQTRSYAQHIAIGGFYDGIVDMTDGIVETIQGKVCNIIMGYNSQSFYDFENVDQVIEYLKELKSTTEAYMMALEPSWSNIENQLQGIVDLIESTIYKLKFLK